MNDKLARRIAEAVAKDIESTDSHRRLIADTLEPVIAAELPPDDAASELLAACEKACKLLSDSDDFRITDEAPDMAKELSAAIARAKGAK